jgi:ABC-type branched-subunit amino acid transport system permease subunit
MTAGITLSGAIVVQGVIYGLGLGLLALGLCLIYRTNRVLNFAQGQLGVLAAVFLVKLYADFHFNYLFALVCALALAAAAGALSELLLRRLFNRPRVLVMVATIGLSQVLLVLALFPFIRPKHLAAVFPVPINLSFTVGQTVITPGEVLTLIVAPVVAVGLALFIRYSPWGLAMRAMAENADSARLSGVWVRRASTLAWTLAGVLSAFAAILASPGQGSVLTQPLSPDLLVLALTAALIGGMVNLTVAFVASIGVGVVYWVVLDNVASSAGQELVLFLLLLLVLLARVGSLRKSPRTQERSTWLQGAATIRHSLDPLRDKVGWGGSLLALAVAVLLPLGLSVGNNLLFANVCIFGVIALSLTVLTGWAGQVSLGQFALVAVGADMAAHLAGSVPLVLLLLFAGAVTAAVAVVVGLPALRLPGLYLAVSTLGFALFMFETVLATPCTTLPLLHRRVCLGLPQPGYTVVPTPSFFGISLSSERAVAWFALGFLVVALLVVRLWRDRGLARRLVSVRDNEVTAAAMGIPVVRTKVLAFALSGFLAGAAGVCYAVSLGTLTTATFDPSVSFLVISMVVIGGLGSVPGAVLGALYLEGLPAIFGSSSTIEFLTSGLGLLAFILYLPGGLAQIMSRLGDLTTDSLRRLRPGTAEATPPAAPPALSTTPGGGR